MLQSDNGKCVVCMWMAAVSGGTVFAFSPRSAGGTLWQVERASSLSSKTSVYKQARQKEQNKLTRDNVKDTNISKNKRRVVSGHLYL